MRPAPASSSSRTCTGPTRPRSTCCAWSLAESSPRPCSSFATYRDEDLDRAHPLRLVLGELAILPGSAGCGCRRCRRRPRCLSGRTVSTPPRSIARPAGTPSTSPRSCAPGARRCRRRCVMLCWRGPPGSTRRHGGCSSVWPSSRRASSLPCSGRSRATPSWPSTSVWRAGCSVRRTTPSLSATRSRVSPSRTRSRASPVALHRATLTALAGSGTADPARLAHQGRRLHDHHADDPQHGLSLPESHDRRLRRHQAAHPRRHPQRRCLAARRHRVGLPRDAGDAAAPGRGVRFLRRRLPLQGSAAS